MPKSNRRNSNNSRSVAQKNADRTDNLTARHDAALLGAVYQTVSMSAGAMEHMMHAARDAGQRDQFTKNMKDYRAAEAAALGRLHRLHETPEEVGQMTRMMSGAGVKLNTALNASTSRLAEIATQTSSVGLTELNAALSANPNASDEAKHIAQAVINLESNNVSAMKNYLK